MPPRTVLSPAEQKRGQRYALLTNLFLDTVNTVVLGGMMMLYANDVLKYEPTRIASVLAIIPLMALLRLPLLHRIRKSGKIQSLVSADVTCLVIVLFLIAIPASVFQNRYWLFIIPIVVFAFSRQLGAATVWQPLMRDITTNHDRGVFFSRMRFSFMAVSSISSVLIASWIGKEITEQQYKWLLAVAALGVLNHLIWVRKIPELTMTDDDAPEKRISGGRRLLQVAKTSPLLRRPLLLFIVLFLTGMPLFIIYLKQMLNVPSNFISFYVFLVTLGSALSFLVWGKVADAIGFRPMLIGLLALSLLVTPLLLFIPPMSSTATGFADASSSDLYVMTLLGLYGFLQGAIGAGMGIATISIEHFHVKSDDSLEAMNIAQGLQVVIHALFMWLSGYFIEEIAIPSGSHPFVGDILHFDAVKVYLIIIAAPLKIAAIFITLRLPNTRPYFGVTDFFSSIFNNPMRAIYTHRRLYDEDEDKRIDLARILGDRQSPLNLQPLFELTDDPSYDVKVEAIRSLGRSGSTLAAEKLLESLKDETRRQVADQCAWALGELKHQPAFDALMAHLDPQYANRIRAMAARALGKLGNPAAVPALVHILKTENASLHLMSSCCRALLRLKAYDSAETVFDTLNMFRERAERYELTYILCDWLDVPNEWILKVTPNIRFREALLNDADLRSSSWIAERLPIIDSLRTLDALRIRQQLSDAMSAREDYGKDPVLNALKNALSRSEQWDALTTLATAWLLLKRK